MTEPHLGNGEASLGPVEMNHDVDQAFQRRLDVGQLDAGGGRRLLDHQRQRREDLARVGGVAGGQAGVSGAAARRNEKASAPRSSWSSNHRMASRSDASTRS